MEEEEKKGEEEERKNKNNPGENVYWLGNKIKIQKLYGKQK